MALAISPLISLLVDQVVSLRRSGVKATIITSVTGVEKKLLIFLICLPSLLEVKKLAAQLLTSYFLLALCTCTRFGKPSSSFNVISNRARMLDANFSWLDFLPNNATLWWLYATEDPLRQTQMLAGCLLLKYFIRAQAPKHCKCHKCEQCHF